MAPDGLYCVIWQDILDHLGRFCPMVGKVLAECLVVNIVKDTHSLPEVGGLAQLLGEPLHDGSNPDHVVDKVLVLDVLLYKPNGFVPVNHTVFTGLVWYKIS